MEVTAIALKNFCHGAINATEGHPLLIQDALARELERHGLVRVSIIPRQEKPKAVEQGKAQDDGRGQPSSASPVAPPSLMQTLHLSKRGGAKLLKHGK